MDHPSRATRYRQMAAPIDREIVPATKRKTRPRSRTKHVLCGSVPCGGGFSRILFSRPFVVFSGRSFRSSPPSVVAVSRSRQPPTPKTNPRVRQRRPITDTRTTFLFRPRNRCAFRPDQGVLPGSRPWNIVRYFLSSQQQQRHTK